MSKFTKEQIEQANNISLEEYLMCHGEELKQSGNEFRWIYHDSQGKHDSVCIKNNRWYDHKNQKGGYTISFLEEFYGLDFKGAMAELLDNTALQMEVSYHTKPKPEFILPEKSKYNQKVYEYLVGKRYIRQEFVDFFVSKGKIYQGFQFNNIVFVGTKPNGIPQSASAKSPYNSFRSTVKGSDMNYGFCHRGTNEHLYVFESAVDMLSFMTLQKDLEKGNSYLSLDGLSPKAMLRFLEEQNNIKHIHICIDHDVAGIETYDKFYDMLSEKGYTINRLLSKNKDWNEDLKELHGEIPKSAVPHTKIEQYQKIAEKMIAMRNRESEYNTFRDEYVKKHGLRFLVRGVCGEVKKLEGNVDDDKKRSQSIVRLIDLSITAICLCDAEKTYEMVLQELIGKYKPYTDKNKLRKRLMAISTLGEELWQEFQTTGACNVEKWMEMVDLGIRLKIYFDLEYPKEMERLENLKRAKSGDCNLS
ncbi:DUF3991 and toprim domain-containing protein [Chakrabartyella piscis]|uniref:DUF3991 and toprim domain-containing protein n=1 Tax=Chakrabartyella piscis TaxID=2918914 RepID=UPI002958AE60|nr:DUF3991 and toprim domain-containing protein [Chakrabartyella piscis]